MAGAGRGPIPSLVVMVTMDLSTTTSGRGIAPVSVHASEYRLVSCSTARNPRACQEMKSCGSANTNMYMCGIIK